MFIHQLSLISVTQDKHYTILILGESHFCDSDIVIKIMFTLADRAIERIKHVKSS